MSCERIEHEGQMACANASTQAHSTCLYSSDSEWRLTLVRHVQAAIARNERVIYVGDTDAINRARIALKAADLPIEIYESHSQLSLVDAQFDQVPETEADPQLILHRVAKEAERAIQLGFTRLCVLGEISCVLVLPHGAERLRAYDARLNQLVHSHPITAVCFYDRRRFAAQVLMNALHAHPVIETEGIALENRFYIPSEVMADPQKADNMLEQRLNMLIELHGVESRLREHENRSSAFLQHSPVAMFLANEEGRIVETNPAACRMTGYDTETLLNLHISGLLTEDAKEAGLNHFESLKRGENPAATLLKFKRHDGTPRDILIDAVKLAPGAYVGFCIDFTELRKAEEARKVSEEEYRVLVNAMPDVVFRIDPDGRVRFSNRPGSMLPAPLGKKQEELFPPEIAKRHHELIQEAIEQGSSRHLEEVIPAVGGRKTIETRLVAIRNTAGVCTGVLGIVRDITEQRRIENRINQAQKLEAIGTLAGGIAHDFNNVLQIILGFAGIALGEDAPESLRKRCLEQIIHAAGRARELAGQILTFSRGSEEESRPIALQNILRDALKLMRGSLPSTIQMHQEIDRHCGPVLANPSQFYQVIVNLCTNAFHAMRDDGGKLTIRLDEVSVSEEALELIPGIIPGRYARLIVQDTGHGMDASTLQRIFDPYFTTKNPSEGTGLGLATVHGIVKNAGGAITVDSMPGKGATFTVLLPICLEVATGHPVKHEGGILPGGHERILFVDDEEPVVQIASTILSQLGYIVESFTDPMAALARFQNAPEIFDLMITDQTMPQLTGMNLARECLRVRPDFPIILSSGYPDIPSEEACQQAGIRGFLKKPAMPLELALMVRGALDDAEASLPLSIPDPLERITPGG